MTLAVATTAGSHSDDAATIRRLTCYDALTGLPNRLLFREQLGLAVRIARRNKQPIAVLLADIDDFRRIKNSLGHRGSDEFIRAVARRIGDRLRDSDVVADHVAGESSRAVARLGGNEFAIVLNGLADPHDAQRVAQRLRDAVASAIAVGGIEVLPTLSIGVALFPGDADDGDSLIECADIALGRAKDLGKDRVQFYSQSMNSLAAERLELEAGLRRALEQQQFFPVYQPRVDSASGRVEGIEALVRWRHPERGVLAPGAFIEASEQCRLIIPIGEFMLEAACRQNRQWQDAGLPRVPVGVNVSPLQVSRGDFVHCVARALERSGLAPQLARTRDHRVGADGRRGPARSAPSRRYARWAFASRSTTSAPAFRRCPTCATSRSTC